MKRILIVDDQVTEFENILAQLNLAGKTLQDVDLIWVPMLITATNLLSIKGYPIDHIYVDVNGTAFQDFDAEINRLRHNSITVVSNVLKPMALTFPFLPKDDLVEDLLKKI